MFNVRVFADPSCFSAPPLTAFPLTNTSVSRVEGSICQEACACDYLSGNITYTRYHNGLSLLPVAGDTLYVDSEGLIPILPASDRWRGDGIETLYRLNAGSSVVQEVINCP